MSGETTGSAELLRTLLPHQEDFLRTFFGAGGGRSVVLRAGPGLGKGTALAALGAKLLSDSPGARVLFVVPARVRVQYAERLERFGVASLAVDRYRFRELLDRVREGPIWPSGVGLVLTYDFARQDDVVESLEAVDWDLLVLDESHFSKGTRAKAIRRLVARASRVAAAILPAAAIPSVLSKTEPPKIVEWRLEDIRDFDQVPIYPRPSVSVEKLSSSVPERERALAVAVGELCSRLQAFGIKGGVWARSLLSCLRSSPAALEDELDRLMTALERTQGGRESRGHLGTLGKDLALPASMRRRDRERLQELAMDAWSLLEAQGQDAKLASLVALVGDRLSVEGESARICIVTEYVSTLYYVATELENVGYRCWGLHWSLPAEERQRFLQGFVAWGNVLVAVATTLSDMLSLSAVTDLVIYDIATDPVELQLAVASVLAAGGKTPFVLHVVSRGSAEEALEQTQRLRKLLGLDEADEPARPLPTDVN